MKAVLWITVPLVVFASVLAGPIPEQLFPEGMLVAKVNNSADPAPNPPQPEHASSSSSVKPEILKDDPLLVKDTPIDGKIDNIKSSSEANVDGHSALVESSTANLDLDQRAAEQQSSSSKPASGANEDLGKSLEESSSSVAPAPEVPREERIETNVVLSDDSNNANASQPQDEQQQQLSTQNPSNEENLDARSQEGKVSPAPVMWNEEIQSSPAPSQEKIERKEDLQENAASSAAPVQLSMDLRHAEEPQPQSSQSPLSDDKIELSAASSEPSLLEEKSVEDNNQNLTLLDEPKNEDEKLDITILKDDKLREKRETIEILLEKEVNPSTSEPQPQPQPPKEAEVQEKLLDEPQEVQPSSQAPIGDIPIAETLSKATDEKLIIPLADEPQESSSSSKPSLSQN